MCKFSFYFISVVVEKVAQWVDCLATRYACSLASRTSYSSLGRKPASVLTSFSVRLSGSCSFEALETVEVG